MDETAPHMIGSTCKMESEFRAKREAERVAVQPRKPRTKAKTLPESPEDDSKPGVKKTDTRTNAASTNRSRNKKGTARIVKKGKVKATEEASTDEEKSEASNAGEALNARKACDRSHKVRSSLTLVAQTSY